jgi:predicted Zn-dependent protease
VVTNDRSDEGLRRAVAQAEALARLAPEDPEYLGELGPQQYAEVAAWADATAELSAEDRARAALGALAPARASNDITVAGFIVCGAEASAVGNSAGLFGYHRATNANYTLTARTRDGTGSGWAGADDTDWARLDFADVARRAIDKARRSRNPVAVEPGRYTVIFEPEATANLVGLLGGALQARAADEGRSAFAKPGGTKVGERIVDGRVTLLSDPRDPLLLGAPFDGDGLPLARQAWIENGVLRQLAYSRFWGQKHGQAPTGGVGSLRMAGGSETTESLVAGCPRGILVTRLWYLRPVDARTLVYTGLTRDGTFLVENGKVVRAIKNLRFNDSPLFMLSNLEGVGAPVRTAGGGRRADGRDAAHPGARLQLHVALRRGVSARRPAPAVTRGATRAGASVRVSPRWPPRARTAHTATRAPRRRGARASRRRTSGTAAGGAARRAAA